MRIFFTVLAVQMALAANAVTVEDMVLVPDVQKPFYINIFEVSDRMFEKVLNKRRYSGDEWPTRVETSQEAHDYCSRLGLRVPTVDEWMLAATNLGQNKNYSVVGDAYKDAGGNKTFNWAGGDSIPVNQDGVGIDAIGTVGMSGNRGEWVVDANGDYLQCGGDYHIKDPAVYHLNKICGGSKSPIWSSNKKTTVRCVIDYSPDIQVTYSNLVSGKLKVYLEKISQGGNGPVVTPGDITIDDNRHSKMPTNSGDRLNPPEPNYNENRPQLDDEF
ncbi:MAG: hypothetical protein A4S09_14360 [Proteobacteria bacterium SG_bin7]|nr:MAG: hypothetical protein A4S09_14360 [Proteobacteria bacterium SG_bin7]